MPFSRSVVAVVLAAVPWLASRDARAFCGFFVAGSNARLTNNASQVVLMRSGNRTVMTMSNDYQGPPESFAMVVPVPVVLHKQDVKTLRPDVFDKVDSLSAPRLVEYWEQDPCPVKPKYEQREDLLEGLSASKAPARARSAPPPPTVKVEARFTAGEYEVVILSATESTGLETWLRQNRYNIPAGSAAALAPYVRDRSKFFVAKVDIAKVVRNANGVVQLSPLRFAFDANELRLPVRLGLLNAGGKQDLIVYVIHPTSRFEVANYANVFIPTNLEVAEGVRASFAPFYAELFDATVERMQRRVVVTEYSWQTTGCDPCPVPPLEGSDLAALGLDVLDPQQARAAGMSWVLTRLHARYSKETLSEDLVFREARPVTGGRANWDGTSGDQGAQVTDGGANNFQGRYIVRHYWTGPAACVNPQWGVWGGATATAAKGLALAPRGKVALRESVQSPVPLLGIPGKAPPRRKTR